MSPAVPGILPRIFISVVENDFTLVVGREGFMTLTLDRFILHTVMHH